jgi:uncharacterized protein (TIGR03435 family)
MTRIDRRWRACALTAGFLVAFGISVSGQQHLPAGPSSQTAEAAYIPTLTFDVASIRQSPPAQAGTPVGSFVAHTSVMRVRNFGIDNLLLMAYGFDHYYLIVGVPDSFTSVLFDIQAKADISADEKLSRLNDEQAKLEQQHMLQVLLTERLHLKAYWATKEGDVYNLVVQNASKLQKSRAASPGAEERKIFGNNPVPALYQRSDGQHGFDTVCHGCSIAMVANMLARSFHRPVIDRTGLDGKYDFTVHYSGTQESDQTPGDIDPLPPLFIAIQQQLGLKLKSARGPAPVLVVDHIEMPSEN